MEKWLTNWVPNTSLAASELLNISDASPSDFGVRRVLSIFASYALPLNSSKGIILFSIPRIPAPKVAARARYGFESAPPTRFSILWEKGDPRIALIPVVLFSFPQV